MPWRCKKCGKIKLPSNLLPSGLCYACNEGERIETAPAISPTQYDTNTVVFRQPLWEDIVISTENARVQTIIRNANFIHSDLVEMSITGLCCGECSKYQGRIYSITGRDTRFPKLPDIVLLTGSLHKDCIHTIYNYKEGDDPLYINGDIFTVSNRPFVDERSEEEKHAFFRDKEGVTTELMCSISGLPYNLSKPIKYDDRYPYIEIDEENSIVVNQHITRLNEAISTWGLQAHGIKQDLCIPSTASKKAKIICTPFTNTLKIAKIPILLHIETNDVNPNNSVVGDISYQANGKGISRATICFWKNKIRYEFRFDGDVDSVSVKSVAVDGKKIEA